MCVQDDSWHVSKTGAFQFLICEETMLSVFLFMDQFIYIESTGLVLQSCMIMFGVYNDQYSISNSISSQMCYSVNVSSSSTVCQSISNDVDVVLAAVRNKQQINIILRYFLKDYCYVKRKSVNAQ